jgi:predicted dehydrogenase
MTERQNLKSGTVVVMFALLALSGAASVSEAQGVSAAAKTRIAVVGLDHDHVWGLLKDIAGEPSAELVAIAESDAALVARTQKEVPASIKFYPDYVAMLDQAKPDAVIVATSNDRHLEILRQCARRHIHYSTEKPMATNAADAREMERLAREANIKLMVNYWNAWVAPSHDLFHRGRAGEVGPIQKIIVQYGHRGPKEIGIRQLALRPAEKRRRGHYGFWLLRRGIVPVVEGPPDTRICDDAQDQGGTEQQGR